MNELGICPPEVSIPQLRSAQHRNLSLFEALSSRINNFKTSGTIARDLESGAKSVKYPVFSSLKCWNNKLFSQSAASLKNC